MKYKANRNESKRRIPQTTMNLTDLLLSRIVPNLARKYDRQEEEIKKIKELVLEGLEQEGGHHKQWYLERIAEVLFPGIDFDELDCERGIIP